MSVCFFTNVLSIRPYFHVSDPVSSLLYVGSSHGVVSSKFCVCGWKKQFGAFYSNLQWCKKCGKFCSSEPIGKKLVVSRATSNLKFNEQQSKSTWFAEKLSTFIVVQVDIIKVMQFDFKKNWISASLLILWGAGNGRRFFMWGGRRRCGIDGYFMVSFCGAKFINLF